jgi:hypothetical protein
MPHKQANIKKLIEINNTTLTSFAVDDFFTLDVLSKRLKKPLKQHADTLCSIYNLFHRRLHHECRYTEMFVNQNEQDILFTVFFDCGQHKYMIAMLSQFDTVLTDQDKIIHELLSSYEHIKESSVSLHDETLPAHIHSLIHDLITHEGDKHLHLKKIETEKAGQNIVFHQVSFPIDFESHRGISILAGFQY